MGPRPRVAQQTVSKWTSSLMTLRHLPVAESDEVARRTCPLEGGEGPDMRAG